MRSHCRAALVRKQCSSSCIDWALSSGAQVDVLVLYVNETNYVSRYCSPGLGQSDLYC